MENKFLKHLRNCEFCSVSRTELCSLGERLFKTESLPESSVEKRCKNRAKFKFFNTSISSFICKEHSNNPEILEGLKEWSKKPLKKKQKFQCEIAEGKNE